MIEHFIIYTLGRIDKQITYNEMPEKYRDRVSFVVQAHEYDAMRERYGDKVICLPEEIKTINPTRQWIWDNYKHTRHAVFDDDIKFYVKNTYLDESDKKWKFKSRRTTDEEFDEMIDTMNAWMDEGYLHVAMQTAWVIPDIKLYPYRENSRIMTNVFLDGPNLPQDLNWNRLPFSADIDVNLQLLTRGYPNRISTRFTSYCSETGAEGGCDLYRTIEKINATSKALKELWPDFIKLKEVEISSGKWKGKTKIGMSIYHKKAYESSKTNHIDDFF